MVVEQRQGKAGQRHLPQPAGRKQRGGGAQAGGRDGQNQGQQPEAVGAGVND